MGAGVRSSGGGGLIRITKHEDGTFEQKVVRRGFPGMAEMRRQNEEWYQKVKEIPVTPENIVLRSTHAPWPEYPTIGRQSAW